MPICPPLDVLSCPYAHPMCPGQPPFLPPGDFEETILPKRFMYHSLWEEKKTFWSGTDCNVANSVLQCRQINTVILAATQYAVPRAVKELQHLQMDTSAPAVNRLDFAQSKLVLVLRPHALSAWTAIGQKCREAAIEQASRQFAQLQSLVLTAADGSASSIDKSTVNKALKELPQGAESTGIVQKFFEVFF